MRQEIKTMTILEAHKNLRAAYEVMKAYDTQTSRDLVLELLVKYNEMAKLNHGLYRPFRNAGSSADVWLVAAY